MLFAKRLPDKPFRAAGYWIRELRFAAACGRRRQSAVSAAAPLAGRSKAGPPMALRQGEQGALPPRAPPLLFPLAFPPPACPFMQKTGCQTAAGFLPSLSKTPGGLLDCASPPSILPFCKMLFAKRLPVKPFRAAGYWIRCGPCPLELPRSSFLSPFLRRLTLSRKKPAAKRQPVFCPNVLIILCNMVNCQCLFGFFHEISSKICPLNKFSL